MQRDALTLPGSESLHVLARRIGINDSVWLVTCPANPEGWMIKKATSKFPPSPFCADLRSLASSLSAGPSAPAILGRADGRRKL